jgi:heme-degrading monooxygenase HmoA
MAETLEVTIFQLAGRTSEEFLAANEDINQYLKRQPGFRWRRITQHEDGTIIDIVAWDSMAQARSGANGISTEMASSPVHATIDLPTVQWRLSTVLQHTAKNDPLCPVIVGDGV